MWVQSLLTEIPAWRFDRNSNGTYSIKTMALTPQLYVYIYVCIYKFWSFRGDWIQWSVLRQTAAQICEGFPTFQKLTPSPSSGCSGDLVAPKLLTWYPALYCVGPSHQFWCYQTNSTPWRWWRSSRNVGKPSHLDAVVCSRNVHYLLYTYNSNARIMVLYYAVTLQLLLEESSGIIPCYIIIVIVIVIVIITISIL